ncbi:hypothetical protein PENTCL1PPCAC_7917, partial [Pristionchus entomophagus]
LLYGPDYRLESSEAYKDDSVFIYVQMELCNYSLSYWLNENKNPSSRDLPRMMRWFKQLVQAVGYIHSKNMIHCDLKPKNLLFTNKDTLKLCDIGRASELQKDINEWKTEKSRSLIESELYRSPELLIERDGVSSKTDVFSLGLILTELCVVMTSEERSEIFDEYRNGLQTEKNIDATTANFVRAFTQVEPSNRPTCTEILAQMFEIEVINESILLNEQTDSMDTTPILNKPSTLVRGFSSKFVNEFVVRKIIGEGGYGCVFRTINRNDRYVYAVKRVEVDSNHYETAVREVQAMAKLRHDGIVSYKVAWKESPPEGWQYESDIDMLKGLGLPRNHLKSMKYYDGSVYI